ncbi:unnamed protein product [Polarella glacialis]|uniref:J domain-containing protein n=2 Tax=Polarella glacialis TaxID=89957 RepID=A0A813L1R8_POLGL|nr:unnamed protein product [Polarella glacialis]
MGTSEASDSEAALPSLAELLGQLEEDERQEEGRERKPLVVPRATVLSDQDSGTEALSSSELSLLLGSGPTLARAVAFCGFQSLLRSRLRPAICGSVPEDEPPEAPAAESCLLQELHSSECQLSERIGELSDEELMQEVLSLQAWRRQAGSRLQVLERRVAWDMLGIPQTQDQAAIRKAFKRRALELHPDKGGDAGHFQLLQDMKQVLIGPDASVAPAAGEGGETGGKPAASDDPDTDAEIDRLLGSSRRARAEEDGPPEHHLGGSAKGRRKGVEATRRRLRQAVLEVWEHAGRLAAEFSSGASSEGMLAARGEALAGLRGFVDSFSWGKDQSKSSAEPSQRSQKAGEEALRRFLQEGAELICAAGALDATATLAEVTLANARLLALFAPSEALQQSCSSLLEAVQRLPAHAEGHFAAAQEALLASAQGELPHDRAEDKGESQEYYSGTKEAPVVATDVSVTAIEQVDALVAEAEVALQSSTPKEPAKEHQHGCVCTKCLRRRWGWQRGSGGYAL